MNVYFVKRGSKEYWYTCLFDNVDMRWHLTDLNSEEVKYESFRNPKEIDSYFEKMLEYGHIDSYEKIDIKSIR